MALSGEIEPGGWFSAGTQLAVTQPRIVCGPLPAFGTALPPRVFRGNEAVDLAWIPPAGGADSYDVAYSSDGGVRWTNVVHGTRPQSGFIPVDTTSRAILEVLARRGDAVVDSWLSAPFIVDLEVVEAGQDRPLRFALRMAGASPARASVQLALDQPATGEASVQVYDIRGARVRTLVREIGRAHV